MERTNALEAIKLSKKFSDKFAVDHLSFNVPEGTITGFIGPNGAGKTTTLRMLATLLQPTSGTIKIFGKDIRTNSRYVRHLLGYMPDHFGLYEDMEVEEYLDFFGAAYHIPMEKRKKMIPELLELLDLTVKTNSLVAELSRGMQQRLSLGRSLVHDPKLLLLDEPASGLDPRARIELMGLLRELRSMGKTIFISSHILAELKDLCDYVVIIEKGRMVYYGTVSEAAASISGQKVRLRIMVAEKAEEIGSELKTVEGVLDASASDPQCVMVEYEMDRLDSSKIIRLLVEKGYAIQEVMKETVNLEDVFMSLTEGGVA